MKKLIAVVTLLFAVTFSANAQDKKVSSQDAAQKDIVALSQKVTISENLKKDLLTLMVMKHDALATASTQADKDAIAEAYGHKILAGLSNEQRSVVEKDKNLMKQLTQ